MDQPKRPRAEVCLAFIVIEACWVERIVVIFVDCSNPIVLCLALAIRASKVTEIDRAFRERMGLVGVEDAGAAAGAAMLVEE